MEKDIQSIIDYYGNYTREELDFFDDCQKYFSVEQIKLIVKSYNAAKDLHTGQKRESGEDYITHPLRVAIILLNEIKLRDLDSICAALLHDTIEDTGIDIKFLSKYFNEEIAQLVDGVTKINSIDFKSKEESNAINNALMLRKILDNPKILLIKLADRLHNMRTLEYKNNPDKRSSKALETLSFYVPIAQIIGSRKVYRELEDKCFYFLSPKDYMNMQMSLNYYINNFKKTFALFIEFIDRLLNKDEISHVFKKVEPTKYEVYKGFNAYHKMKLIPDIFKIKIIVDDKEQCYEVFKKINMRFKIKNFQNHINEPKMNGFRALTFVIETFRQVSVEVCTKNMDYVNEFGYAGLFNTGKEPGTIKQTILQSSFMQMLNNISQRYQQDWEFFTQVNKHLLVEHIKVYTPKRQIIWLSNGSTVKDFAYQIHTQLGQNAIGAIVNGKLVSIDYILKNDDVVEVLTRELDRSEFTRKRAI